MARQVGGVGGWNKWAVPNLPGYLATRLGYAGSTSGLADGTAGSKCKTMS
jgi:hypothetical protein